MKNSVRIKAMAGYMNLICDNSVSFSTLITDLRKKLEIIEQKKIRNISFAIWLENREINDSEKLELFDTLQSYGISSFECIN